MGTNAEYIFRCVDTSLRAHVLHNSFYVFVCREAKPNFHSADKETFAAARTQAAIRDADSAAAKPRSSSPHEKRASPLTVREAGPQRLPKPLQAPSPVPSVSPLLKRRKAEASQTCPPARVRIPTILVEDEPMETGPGSPDKGKTPIISVRTFG